jgi:S1-C subfamily serine protease
MNAKTFRRISLACLAVLMAVVVGGVSVAAEDLDAVRAQVERTLPLHTLQGIVAGELGFRRALTPREFIYNTRVDGVVLLASTKTVATGMLVSDAGDIITNDHIVQHAQRVGGHDWIAVWFRSSTAGPHAIALGNFMLARVVQREPRHDLARLRLAQTRPQTATVIPLGSAMPSVGTKVFTIGHPGSAGWKLGEGTVANIRPSYQWHYADGVTRNATAIQLAADITTGNSGGPLFDDRGAMVGVVVGSAVRTQGVGFAVAVQHVRDLLSATAGP